MSLFDAIVLIDFGLAYRASNLVYVRKHLRYLFQDTYSVYDAYPYEYLAYHGYKDKGLLREEYEDYQKGILRENQDGVIDIREHILGIPKGNTLRKITDYQNSVIKGTYKPSLQKIVTGLDMYSVGMLVPTILMDVSIERDVPKTIVSRMCKRTSHPEIFKLFRDMTEFYSTDRLSITDAYNTILDICKKEH